MKTNRRNFLKGLGLAGTAAAIPGWTSRLLAQEVLPSHLVMIHVGGGMQSLLGLDPLVLNNLTKRRLDPITLESAQTSFQSIDRSKFFAGYQDSDLLQAGPHLFGQGASPLLPIANEISVISGVMMIAANVSHEENGRYARSAYVSGGEHFSLAAGTLLQKSRNANFIAEAVTNSQNDDLVRARLLNSGELQGNSLSMLEIAVGRAKLAGDIKRANQLQSLISSNAQLSDLAKEYQSKFATNSRNNIDPASKAKLAALFNLQLAGSAGFNFFANVDSHSNHRQGQVQGQQDVWQEVMTLVNGFKSIECLDPRLKGQSLYDRTTFLVTTDFSRSAYQEGPDGTGHNPLSNTFLIFGNGIRGGTKTGESTVFSPRIFSGEQNARLMALPYNFSEGRSVSLEEMATNAGNFMVDTTNGNQSRLGSSCKNDLTQPCVDYISPGNVLRTVAEALQIPTPNSVNGYKPLRAILK